MEDFAEGVWAICYPSFRLSPSLPTSVPFLKICKFWSWLSSGVDLKPFFFLFSFWRLHLCLCLCRWAGRAQHSESCSWHIPAASRQKTSVATLRIKNKDTLFCTWASLQIYADSYSSWKAQWVRPSQPRRLRCICAFKAWCENRDYFLVGLLFVFCIHPTCWHINWQTLKTQAAVWTEIPRWQYRAVTTTLPSCHQECSNSLH